ncbi:response regulator [Dactylosporangium fulvum]|uniref:Response regulator n=1 Tax=Dactylosporangium fulvum TaxID=53359 RepID=A0ABY5WC58_9ACTN|nr:response regulator [Dactylosporangium fulvum]UWP86841.1 response regulator [Dactylosporangium fulvum]
MEGRPRVLCVDDEPYVLDGLRRYLRADYDVLTATQPRDALELLGAAGEEPVAVVVSDMRMPQMTGVDVLERVREISPETTRVLLTGDADVQGAVAAINVGNVFRFMLKPCPPEDLKATVAAAAEQNRLVRAERELLEATLKGCVDALMDTLGMAQPALFSRAGRLQRLVQRLCQRLEVTHAWQIEIAAQMGEIGAITLPPETLSGMESGIPASAADAEMLARLPQLADNVLARIPRLEAVREIVRHQLPTDRSPMSPLRPDAPEGAWILQAVREFDALVWRGMPPDLAVATLSARKIFAPELVRALAEAGGMRVPREAVREIGIDDLAIGHELADDVYSAKGMLLVSRGQVITERLLVRLQNYEMTTGLKSSILIVDLPGPR